LKARTGSELAGIAILTILLVIIITSVPSNPLRVVLGLPFLLFFPGYTFVATLFPKKTDLGGIERIALSFGLSIAIVPLIGLILNYTPWGIKLYSILVSISIFILAASVAAWYRRNRLSQDERLSVNLNISFTQLTAMKGLDKALSVFLALSILAAVGTIAYVMISPKTGEKFTEFYILGPEGKAEGYPTELEIGEEGIVILGIVNHEQEEEIVYRVEILIDGEVYNTVGPLRLENDEIWEEEISFSPRKAGDDQKVEFILYKQAQGEPSNSLHLWLDVTGIS
jgi:uncharacterized membrane protein